MSPTLKVPDVLHVEPVDASALRAGDIVVFRGMEGRHTVHRVIAAMPEGCITRGDSNRYSDPDMLEPPAIIGKVVRVSRRNRTRTVRGGTPGMVEHYAARWGKLLVTGAVAFPLFAPFRAVYRTLSEEGTLRKMLPVRWHPKIYRFRKPWGEELHLMLGNKRIGTCMSGSTRWQIRVPFRLFVDERSLPKPEAPPCSERGHVH